MSNKDVVHDIIREVSVASFTLQISSARQSLESCKNYYVVNPPLRAAGEDFTHRNVWSDDPFKATLNANICAMCVRKQKLK